MRFDLRIDLRIEKLCGRLGEGVGLLYSAVDCEEGWRAGGVFASFGIACCDTPRLVLIAAALLLTDYRQLNYGRAETTFTASPPHVCLVLGNLAHHHFDIATRNFRRLIGHGRQLEAVIPAECE